VSAEYFQSRATIYDALIETGIRLIHARHEAARVHMADAYACITGQVGITLVTGGPGHTNGSRKPGRADAFVPLAKSVNVQRAIAGILIRADYQSIAKPKLVQTLREHRLKSPDGEDSIDILIRQPGAS
jgi:glyoxylate carboligase